MRAAVRERVHLLQSRTRARTRARTHARTPNTQPRAAGSTRPARRRLIQPLRECGSASLGGEQQNAATHARTHAHHRTERVEGRECAREGGREGIARR